MKYGIEENVMKRELCLLSNNAFSYIPPVTEHMGGERNTRKVQTNQIGKFGNCYVQPKYVLLENLSQREREPWLTRFLRKRGIAPPSVSYIWGGAHLWFYRIRSNVET